MEISASLPGEESRALELESEYAEAFAEWEASVDAAFWDQMSGGGISDEAG